MLITGLSSFWGGRLALAFEQDPSIDVIVGMDTADPVVALERTEFVRTDESYSILARLVRATQVDTVVHAALVVDSTLDRGRSLHEFNVIGTMNLLAAAAADDSQVQSLVVKSSTLVYGSSARDPTWFREDTRRPSTPRTPLERSLVEAESYLQLLRDGESPRQSSGAALRQRPGRRPGDTALAGVDSAIDPDDRGLRSAAAVCGAG